MGGMPDSLAQARFMWTWRTRTCSFARPRRQAHDMHSNGCVKKPTHSVADCGGSGSGTGGGGSVGCHAVNVSFEERVVRVVDFDKVFTQSLTFNQSADERWWHKDMKRDRVRERGRGMDLRHEVGSYGYHTIATLYHTENRAASTFPHEGWKERFSRGAWTVNTCYEHCRAKIIMEW